MTSQQPSRLRRSPKRRALHERSDSHTNEISLPPTSPTLRVVGDSDAKVYASSPFPTRQSQVLSPPRGPFYVEDVSVSFQEEPTNPTFPSPLVPPPLVPRTPQHLRPAARPRRLPSPHYGSGLEPCLESSPPDNEPSSSLDAKESPETAESPSSLGVDRPDMDGAILRYDQASEEVIGRGRTLVPHPVTPEQNNRPSLRTIVSVASHLSIDSAGSTETVIKTNIIGPPPRGSYAALIPISSRPSSSRSIRSVSAPARPADIEIINHRASRVSLSPVSSTSPTSPVSPLSEPSPEFETPPPRLYQAPQYARSETQFETFPSALQYPVVQAPAATGSVVSSATYVASVAESATSSGFRIPRRPVGGRLRSSSEKWNTQLSTIQSEGSNEQSGSGGTDSRRDTRITSTTSSLAVARSSGSSYYLPMPFNPTFTRSRDITGSTIRIVREEDNSSSSSSLEREKEAQNSVAHNGVARNGTQKTVIGTGPGLTRQGTGSRGNFFRDSIPAWARYFHRNGQRQLDLSIQRSGETNIDQRLYYANENRNILPPVDAESRPPTQHSQSSFAYGIFRTRTLRPKAIATSRPQTRDSMVITPVTVIQPDTVIEVHGSQRKPRTSPSWSPHLWHDRRNAKNRRSVFIAPSLDEKAEGKALTRRNAQVWLFALGFLFAPAWILAAFLPLPPAPSLTPINSPAVPTVAHDIEKALGPIDQARYENARWWRNVNRFLSIIGVLIIIAIIVLAAIGSRTYPIQPTTN